MLLNCFRIFRSESGHPKNDFANNLIIDFENWQVYDGISVSECACHGGITYTYTAGTLLGGMIELHVKTKSSSFLQNNNNATIDFLSLALRIADSAIRFHIRHLWKTEYLLRLMTKDGVLVEHCDLDQSCNLDQQIFKGIFVRNLRWPFQTHLLTSALQVSHRQARRGEGRKEERLQELPEKKCSLFEKERHVQPHHQQHKQQLPHCLHGRISFLSSIRCWHLDKKVWRRLQNWIIVTYQFFKNTTTIPKLSRHCWTQIFLSFL